VYRTLERARRLCRARARIVPKVDCCRQNAGCSTIRQKTGRPAGRSREKTGGNKNHACSYLSEDCGESLLFLMRINTNVAPADVRCGIFSKKLGPMEAVSRALSSEACWKNWDSSERTGLGLANQAIRTRALTLEGMLLETNRHFPPPICNFTQKCFNRTIEQGCSTSGLRNTLEPIRIMPAWEAFEADGPLLESI